MRNCILRTMMRPFLVFILFVLVPGNHVKCMESLDGYSVISIMEAGVHEEPKTNSIIATIDGHFLSVTFTENLGQVSIDISTATGLSVDFISSPTPNGVMFYIPNTGSYVITFTLPNGNQYYGEFEVTD